LCPCLQSAPQHAPIAPYEIGPFDTVATLANPLELRFDTKVAAISMLVAVAIAVSAMGQVNAADWFRTFLIVFVTAIALHRLYWKPSGISDAIDRANG
jgi:hypothetical protein